MKRDIFAIANDKVSVAPSLLAADFACLADEIKRVEQAGADLLHWDIMDGHFVPNLTMGPMIMKALRPHTELFFDVHLMIEDPLKYAPEFVKAGADLITFHLETEKNVAETIAKLRQLGCFVGVSIKPNTPVELLLPHLPQLDLVLIMSVEPGFGGQSFMPEVLSKVTAIRQIISQKNLNLHLQIDGGIDENTVHQASNAGANMMVAGTAVFGHKEGADVAIHRLHVAQVNLYHCPQS